MKNIKCAIIGSGNIGTDLMYKILRNSNLLDCQAVIGIDPESEGLALAKDEGVYIASQGLAAFAETDTFKEIEIFFLMQLLLMLMQSTTALFQKQANNSLI
jgi:acetaldehyde dehydrogenase